LTTNNIHKGDFVLGKDFKSNIQKIEDEKVVKSIASQLFEVCIHRVNREFESVHSKNNFNLLENSESGIEMIVSGRIKVINIELKITVLIWSTEKFMEQ